MNNVQDHLKVYNMTDLTRLGRTVGVKNVSTLKKDNLIESITERLQLPKTAEFAYKYIDERSFCTWQRAAEEGIDVTQENYSLEDVFGLYIMGYAFEDPDNEDEFFLTPTIQNLFSEVDGEDNREARIGVQRHLNLIRAALHLYGIVSFGELIHLFKKYYDETITGDALVEFLEQSPYDITIDEEKEEIVIDDMNDEQYEMVKQLQGDRPYYEPEFAKFIKFSSPYYIDESEYHMNLKQFVRDRMVTDESEVEDSYIDILQLIMTGSKRNDIVDFLMQKDVEFNDAEEQRKFFEDIAGIVENTRHFKYRGYKESELKTKTIVKEIKVGRNDPCPCGSGKKYKKCCGA